MTTPITLLAHITARPGQTEAVEAGLRQLVEASRQESGCLQYDLHRQLEQPELFVMIEQWRDDAALDAHRNEPHYLHFGKTFGDQLVGVELQFLQRIA